MARNWSNLNNDMLHLIAGKLRTLEYFTRLGAVCSSNWMSVLEKQDGPIFGCTQLPWLILPCDHECDDPCQSHRQSRRAYSMMENKIHHLDFPEAFGKKCVGSSYGWLIMVEDVSPAIFMLNPLTKRRIDLPPVTTMPEILDFNKDDVGCEYIVRDIFYGGVDRMSLKDIEEFFTFKIILSNDPEEEECIAVALCGALRRLVFCRIGDGKWTQVEHDLKPAQNDVVYSKGKFYVVNSSAMVGVFDVKNSKVTTIHETPYGVDTNHEMFLPVDATGALLLISRWVEFVNILSEHDDDNNNFEKNIKDGEILSQAEYDVDNNGDHNILEDDDDADNVDDNDYDDQEPPDYNPHNNYCRITKDFNVFKLDEQKNEWNKVRDIGENIVFLGENQSICYSTIEFPEVKRNCIYFTDGVPQYGMYQGHDIGIFNIEDGLIRKFPCINEDMPLRTIFPRAVWFTPSIRSSSRIKII